MTKPVRKPMDAISYILLAEQSRGDSFREGFRNRGAAGHDDVLLGLLIVATLVAGMWAVSRLVGLRRRRRGYNSPWRLFWALAKAHHLTWSESWLLRRVARDQGLRHPGRLFLESQLWDEKDLGSRFALELSPPQDPAETDLRHGERRQPRTSRAPARAVGPAGLRHRCFFRACPAPRSTSRPGRPRGNVRALC